MPDEVYFNENTVSNNNDLTSEQKSNKQKRKFFISNIKVQLFTECLIAPYSIDKIVSDNIIFPIYLDYYNFNGTNT